MKNGESVINFSAFFMYAFFIVLRKQTVIFYVVLTL
jgi:hypothetical protein